jgi:hypothetical protein
MAPEVEQELARKLKWSTVEAVPGFPTSDFHTLKRMSESGELSIGVDYTAANQLAHSIFGSGYSLTIGLLQWTPFLVAIASIPMAFVLRSFWVIAGSPLALFAMFFANPMNPAKGFATLTGLAAVLAAVWFAAQGSVVLAFVPVAYALPFWVIRFVYFWNASKLRVAALQSETLLLFLLQNRSIYVRNQRTGATFWAPAELGGA